MKKGLLMMLSLSFVLALTACGETKAERGASAEDPEQINYSENTDTEADGAVAEPERPEENEVPEIVMYASPEACGSAKTVFILQNNSERKYTYGPEYDLEEYADSEWREIVLDDPLVWNAVVYPLEAKSSGQLEIEWEFGYGELKDGRYRLRKDFCDGDGNRVTVYAEFDIPTVSCGLPPAPEGFSMQ